MISPPFVEVPSAAAKAVAASGVSPAPTIPRIPETLTMTSVCCPMLFSSAAPDPQFAARPRDSQASATLIHLLIWRTPMNDGGALAPSDSLSDYPHPTQAHGHSMEAGRSRLFQPPGARRWLLLVLVLTGCAAPLGHVDRALLAHRHNMPGADNPDAAYTVASPDVLLVHIAGKAELNGRHKVGP